MTNAIAAAHLAVLEKILGVENPRIVQLTGSGSNRQYYRATSPSRSVIYVKGNDVRENATFLYLARHFGEKGLPVPEVLWESEDGDAYIQTDGGQRSLFDFIARGRETGFFSEAETAKLVEVVQWLPKFQYEGAEGLDFAQCYPQEAFDERTVRWDLNYFKYAFLRSTGVAFNESRLEDDFDRFVELLCETAGDGKTFLYRDFQSRNVMLSEAGQPMMIDFQGGRRGPIYYDLASFVYQAKAAYPKDLKARLIAAYYEVYRPYGNETYEAFLEKFYPYVLFRLMQVLGAYGFRGFLERKAHFMQSIPPALKSIGAFVAEHPGYRQQFPEMVGALEALTTFDYSKLLPPDAFLKMPPLPPAEEHRLVADVFSFSYKKAIPTDPSGNGGGYVFDCRGVHNPGRYAEYKNLTGLDEPVKQFLEQDGEIATFLEAVYALADAHVARYMERGFTHLQFAFGCTGGQHRSVYAAQHTAEHLHEKFGIEVRIHHLEQHVEQTLSRKA